MTTQMGLGRESPAPIVDLLVLQNSPRPPTHAGQMIAFFTRQSSYRRPQPDDSLLRTSRDRDPHIEAARDHSDLQRGT